MDVKTPASVDVAIKTLGADERRKVSAWFTHLKNWENDEHTRSISKPTSYKDVYVLNTSDDLRIFFALDLTNRVITVLDIVKPSRFESMRQAAE